MVCCNRETGRKGKCLNGLQRLGFLLAKVAHGFTKGKGESAMVRIAVGF